MAVNDTVLGSIAEFDKEAKPKRKRPFTEPIGTDLGLRFPMLGTRRRRR